MTDTVKNLTTAFIDELIANEKKATIFLVNGVKLQGEILEQDETSFILTTTNSSGKQLVNKLNVTTITGGN